MSRCVAMCSAFFGSDCGTFSVFLNGIILPCCLTHRQTDDQSHEAVWKKQELSLLTAGAGLQADYVLRAAADS